MGRKSSFLASVLISAAVLLGFIDILLNSGGKTFWVLFAGTAFLFILALLGMARPAARGRKWFFFFFASALLGLAFIWHFTTQLYLVLLVVSLVGFLLHLPVPKQDSPPRRKAQSEDLHSRVFDAQPTLAQGKAPPKKRKKR